MLSQGLIASKGYSGRHIADGEEETEEHLRAMSWDERVEWIMQTIRTVALRCTYKRSQCDVELTSAYVDGASMIHTTTAHPDTFKLVRSQVLNLLYKIPPTPADDNANPDAATRKTSSRLAAKLEHRFPFAHTAKPLDRDTLLIPVGWDTPNKIKILREGFNVQKIGSLWDEEIERRTRPRQKARAGEIVDRGEQSLMDLWNIVVPDATRRDMVSSRDMLSHTGMPIPPFSPSNAKPWLPASRSKTSCPVSSSSLCGIPSAIRAKCSDKLSRITSSPQPLRVLPLPCALKC